MDPIKEAFSRIKEDILSLQEQMRVLNQQLEEIKRTLENKTPTQTEDNQTIQQINPTLNQIPTDNLPFKALKDPILSVSTGNGGVPTNSQTDRQSNQQAEKSIDFYSFHSENNEKSDQISQIQRVSEVLESLDSIKKEIRSNFKQLTNQEMAVFSIIYTLEEQGFVVDYSLISQKLGLSESSIRDYTHKIIKKGVPLVKIKENNKKVTLSISSDLKKIASLQTILSLRNL
jgi:type II secretory pathway pseudopilin PulG